VGRWRVIGSRLATFVVSLLAASLLIFLALNLLPGDVAQAILGTNADPDALAALREQLGLNRPAVVRYLDWLGHVLIGDFGDSALTGRSVLGLIAPKLAITGWLVTLGMAVAVLVAVPVGMYAAFARRRWSGFAVSALSQVGMSVPAFLAGILLVLLFSVHLQWFPANGYTSLSTDPVGWAEHMVLPVIALAIVQSSVLVRYVRSAFIEVLGEDYFRTARAVGWPVRAALLRHGLRNAGLSVVTVLGLQLATLFVGAIVVESVFAIPGLGTLLLNAVLQRDLVLVQGIVMVLVMLVLLINAIVDIAYVLLDPRLRSREDGDAA